MSAWALSEVPTVAKMNQKTVFVGASAPASPADGQIWYDTGSKSMKKYDNAGVVWRPVECVVSATAPSPTIAGMLWYDTTADKLKFRNSGDTAWKEAGVALPLAKSDVSTVGTWAQADIPTLAKSKIDTAGTWAQADIPTLDKSKISTTGTWLLADLPAITQSSIVSTTTGISTGSTTYVDITALTITLTTGANPTLIFWTLDWQPATGQANGSFVAIVIDGVVKAEANAKNDNGSAILTTANYTYLQTLTAAAHTIKLQWRTSAGTTYIGLSASMGAKLTVVELKK